MTVSAKHLAGMPEEIKADFLEAAELADKVNALFEGHSVHVCSSVLMAMTELVIHMAKESPEASSSIADYLRALANKACARQETAQ